MKIVSRILLLSVLVVALISSCAQKETISYDQVERASLDAWMNKYHGDDPEMIKSEKGIYYKILTPAPANAVSPVENEWVEVLYTGYSMPDMPVNPLGNVFVTRDSTVAAHEGSTGLYKTHYAPKKMIVSIYTGELTQAMYDMLLQMKQGETRRFYAPSSVSYGSYGSSSYFGSYGYQGYNTLPINVPSYMDMELVRVITDVEADESDQVYEYANAHMEITDRADTLMTDFFLKITPNDINADSIKEDSTMQIYYVGMLLDGFIFDTNIDSIALRVFNDSSVHDPLDYTPSDGGLIDAFYYAVTTMTYDSWGEMVFSSVYGYPSGHTPTGSSGTTLDYGTQFDLYTPMYFKFYIMPKDTD